MQARLSLTHPQRAALLALPVTEEAFVRHYVLSEEDRAAVARCRTPETQLAFALQLCVLRHPGRVLRRGKVIPFTLLAFVADQIGVTPEATAGFARRPDTSTRPPSRLGSGSVISPSRTGHTFRHGWRRWPSAPLTACR